MPRPSLKTPELVEEILSRLSKGEPLAAVCREEGKPVPTTWNRWCAEDEELNIAHGRARDEGFDAIAASCLEIADATGNDTLVDPESGHERPNSEWISRSKLRVETRLKLLAKWDPRRYGDKQLVGSDPENPLPNGFAINLIKPK